MTIETQSATELEVDPYSGIRTKAVPLGPLRGREVRARVPCAAGSAWGRSWR